MSKNKESAASTELSGAAEQIAAPVVSTGQELVPESAAPAAPAPMPPSVGRIVHYRLATRDVQKINEVRSKMLLPGNTHEDGQVLPAIIVRVFDANGHEGVGASNLQVFTDGEHRDLWVTSATRGNNNGQWNWPPKS